MGDLSLLVDLDISLAPGATSCACHWGRVRLTGIILMVFLLLGEGMIGKKEERDECTMMNRSTCS